MLLARSWNPVWIAATLLCGALYGEPPARQTPEPRASALAVTGALAAAVDIEILLLDDNDSPVGRGITGAGGRFRIPVRDPGHYKLALQRNGRLQILDTVSINSSEPVVTVNLTFPGAVSSPQNPGAMISAARLGRKIPHPARRLYEQAVERGRRNDAAGAVERLEKAVALAPDYLEALNNLSVQYMRRKDHGRAESTLRRAIALDPSSWQPHMNLGVVLLEQEKHGEAQGELEQAQALEPRAPLPPFHLGRLHLLEGRGRQAEASFSRALEIEPRFGTAQLFRAYARIQAGNREAAQTDLLAYLRRSPEAANAEEVRRLVEQIRN